MTLPTGTIQMSDVNAELGRAWNATIDMNDPAVRALSGATGNWSTNHMALLRGKSYFSISGKSDTNNNYTTDSGGGTATAFPSVIVTGGTSPYTYAWTMDSYSGAAPTLSQQSSVQAKLSRSFAKLSGGSFSASLTCVVTDASGKQLSVSGVIGAAAWDSANR